jgi:hypothetical protein
MRPKKKSLSLNRETIRQLTASDLDKVVGGVINRPTVGCPTAGCPTQRHSCFNSCYDSDCCLEVP